MVRRALISIVLLGVLLVPAGAADGAVTRKKAMWGPLEVNGVPQMPVYADLGVGIYQTTLQWNEVAPTKPRAPRDPADPAYRWPAAIDRAVEEGARHGIQVSVMVIFTPPWANGGKSPEWAPTNPRDFGEFTEAASRRYPNVRHWMIWGEPSKAQNFQPLDPDRGKPLRASRRRGPRLYARMLDSAYAHLKRVSRANVVIGGNTYTIGTVAPLRYIRAMRLPNGRPPRMDLFGHNPFSLRKPDLRARPLGNGFADFNDLDELTRTLDANFRRATVRRQRKVKVFISEFTLPTDHPNFEFNFYLDHATQADWLGRALKITRGWSRIYTFGYLGLYDDPVRPNGDQVERGLIQRDGTRKPAYEAYRKG